MRLRNWRITLVVLGYDNAWFNRPLHPTVFGVG